MTGKKPLDQEISEKADSQYRDNDLEVQLAAYAMRVNPTLLNVVDPEWFTDIILQEALSVARELRVKLSKSMLLNELRNRNLMKPKERRLFSDALVGVFDSDIASMDDKSARHIAQQLLRLAESRKVIATCGNIVSRMREFDLDGAKRKLSEVSRVVDVSLDQGVHYLDHYEQRLGVVREKEDRANVESGTAGIKTGVYLFDRITGGLMPKEFGLIAGVTGVGKTAALIEFGTVAYEAGHNVFIGSGEMSIEELGFRIDSRLSRIHGVKFRTAELDADDYKKWDSTIKYYRATRENTLFLSSYPRRFTMEDFARDVKRVEDETGRKIDVVCLDYINILQPVRKGRSDAKDQSEAVWDFKSFCSDHNVVGWTAGQVIDDAYDKELYDPSDIKYARAISEAAPVIIALIRTDKDRVNDRMKLQVIKMRNADTLKKTISLTPNLGIMRLHEEVRGEKPSLDNLPSNVVDVQRKARKSKPRKKTL